MQLDIVKIKKIGLYILAAVGGLAIIWTIFGSAVSSLSLKKAKPFSPSYELDKSADYYSPQGLSAQSSGEGRSAQSSPVMKEGELTQRKVIRNGSLSLLIKNAEETASNIKSVADGLGGFVQNSQVYEVSVGVKSGTVSIRVPANRFDEAMSKLKQLAVKIERETIDASDVTEQFIDLEARLKTLQAQEQQFLEILNRAETVEDTLKVVEHLNRVRSQVEQMEGQLTYLARQVDMSVITASLTEEADVEVFGIRWRPLFVVKQAFRNMLTGLTGYADSVIKFAFYLPLLILRLFSLILIAFVGLRILLWVWKKFFAGHFRSSN